MQLHLHRALRCGAKTRRGSCCQAPAMRNGRCRMHGGRAGAPKGNQNAFKYCRYTARVIAAIKALAALVRESRTLLTRMDGL